MSGDVSLGLRRQVFQYWSWESKGKVGFAEADRCSREQGAGKGKKGKRLK
jgi:hypothetical protein